MFFAFTDEQEELRKNARRLLETASSGAEVRKAMASERGYDETLWHRLGEELGFTSLAIPEAYGGAGLGFVELAAVLEEMGRALLCSPFFSTVCLAANAILHAGTEAQKRELLPAIAAGRTTATVALLSTNGRWDALGSGVSFVAKGDDFELTGQSSFVMDGHTADLVLVVARPGVEKTDARSIAPRASPRNERGAPSIFVIPASTPGLQRRALATMDMTRKQAEITLRQVRVPASARLGFDASRDGDATPNSAHGEKAHHGVAKGAVVDPLARALDLAKIALAAEQIGGAERCLDMSVEYAKTRVQFGRPIGSFQAIKHKLADMFVQVESAKSAAYYAAWTAAHEESEIAPAAALVKSFCSDAYFQVAAECIQIHGGVGFTWEHDAHLFFKRAKSSETLFGDASFHRAIVARQMGL
jgi:alkylation response protein AidB-like acyl-CoA dehydrogenase